MASEDLLFLVDQLIATFANEHKTIDTEEEQILSQTLNAKSKIYIVNGTDSCKEEFFAKNSESGLTSKLRLTNKSLQIYYPQPIIFDSSATTKSKGSRLATDMTLKTRKDVTIFHTKLSDILTYKINTENKSENVTIHTIHNTQCVFTLSKWSAQTLNQTLSNLIAIASKS